MREKFEIDLPLQRVKTQIHNTSLLQFVIGGGFLIAAIGFTLLLGVTSVYILLQLLQFNLIFAALGSVFLMVEGLVLALGVFEAIGSR